MRRGLRRRVLLLASLVWMPALAMAIGPAASPPRIALVIDDLGADLEAGRRVLGLPGPLTCAFLPHTPHAATLAEAAHADGKEVILHQPMQAMDNLPLGPGGVYLDTTERDFRETVTANLAAVPHAVGINNHMGSLLTRHPGHMTWLMTLMRERDAGYFLDSRTTAATVAERMAREQGVPTVRRDVFLDHQVDRDAIHAQFRRLVALAHRQGFAVGIGHPHPETLAVLERELTRLQAHGVVLVPLSELVSVTAADTSGPARAASAPRPGGEPEYAAQCTQCPARQRRAAQH